MATDISNLEEDFRAVIKRFHAFVFSERDPVRKLDWIHARVRDTSRPVDPPQGEIKKFESELDNERETFAEMATSLGRTVEEMIECYRPKPSLEWRPLFCSSDKNQAPDVSDCVFLLSVAHDSIGPYRETPMMPNLAADGDDFIVGLRWEAALDGLPRPEDRIQDWEPPSWFVRHVVPRIDEWFKRVQEAFALEFGGAERPAEGAAAKAAGQVAGGVPDGSPEQPAAGAAKPGKTDDPPIHKHDDPHTFVWDDKPYPIGESLQLRQKRILMTLRQELANGKTHVSHDTLVHRCWPKNRDAEPETVDVHLTKIRQFFRDQGLCLNITADTWDYNRRYQLVQADSPPPKLGVVRHVETKRNLRVK